MAQTDRFFPCNLLAVTSSILAYADCACLWDILIAWFTVSLSCSSSETLHLPQHHLSKSAMGFMYAYSSSSISISYVLRALQSVYLKSILDLCSTKYIVVMTEMHVTRFQIWNLFSALLKNKNKKKHINLISGSSFLIQTLFSQDPGWHRSRCNHLISLQVVLWLSLGAGAACLITPYILIYSISNVMI